MNRFGFWCLVMVLMASACSRSTTVGCPANQICTEIFTSVGTRFVDRNGNSTFTSGDGYSLKVFAVNYNVLRIMSGMGGLAYSN